MAVISAMNVLRVGASAMLAHERALDVVSNNMANAGTTAFAPSRVEFKELLQGQIDEDTSGVAVNAVRHLWQQGAIRNTGRDLDVAIRGDGYFRVALPDGTVGYTRDGSLQRAASGALCTADGYYLDPPIVIAADVADYKIGEDGTVSVLPAGSDEWTDVGVITLATFANPEGLEHVGRGIYISSVASGEPAVAVPGQGRSGTLVTRALEQSSVQLSDEMVDLIAAQRLYSLGVKIVQTADEMQSMANQLIRS